MARVVSPYYMPFTSVCLFLIYRRPIAELLLNRPACDGQRVRRVVE